MKVLHVYAGNLFGGRETMLITLARERIYCPQMQPHFALCFEGRLAEELRSVGGNVHLLGKVKVSLPWTVWRVRRQFAQLLKQEDFDVVVCHGCWVQGIFGRVARKLNLPLVFWSPDTPKGNNWLEIWAKRTPPDMVIANSYYTQAAMPNLYPEISCHLVYNPVTRPNILDCDSVRRAVRAELNAPEEATVIIQASRLERWKGQAALISALGQLRDLPGWLCWIAGGSQRPHEAEYLQELEGQARELGIGDRVRFLGQRTDVPQLLVAADIHCQPNTGPEPFGIAFIEALYAGLPVVTTAMGGGAEVVDESCGRLVAPNDDKGLSEVLKSLIINPNERAALAAGGPARAYQLCDPARQLQRLYELLVKLPINPTP